MKQNYLIKTLLLVLTMFVSMGTWAEKGTILFGTPNVKITSSSVTAEDNLGNSWTISSTGTTSYTQQPTYSQIGSSSKPASSIVFTTTLDSETTLSDISIKLGGFTGTAGNVSIKVNGSEVGSGSLNATNDVTVTSSSSAKGNTITITISNIAKGVKAYGISYETNGSGTPTVKYGIDVADDIANGTVTASAETAAEGSVINLTATPDDGYLFAAWNVTDADDNAITVTDNKFTMPASDVTISATFEKKQAPVGNLLTIDLTEDETTTATDEMLQWVKSVVTITANKADSQTNTNNYYPGSPEKRTSTRFYKGSTLTFNQADGITINAIVITATTTGYASAFTKATWYNATTSIDGAVVTIIPESNSKAVVASITENAGASSIDIYYSGEATEPTTATISLKANCTDGDFVYGTYSNASAWVVPANLIVSEIGIVDGLIVTESYETGDVVPAKTGVLVAALDGGNYTINLSDKAGESVLGEENALKASSVAMTGDNKFYRLTMHKGEQIGFWWGAEDGAAFSIEANKAYLAVSNEAAEAKANFWFGGETVIKNINANSNKVIYNLAGQRVMNAQKGLYIINGKKVVK